MAKDRPIALRVGRLIRENLLPQRLDYDLQNQFLPIGRLTSIFPAQVVVDIVSETFNGSESEIAAFANQILGDGHSPSRLKILATLILIEKLKYLKSFVAKGLFDDSLPLEPEKCASLFPTWSPHHVDVFCERQYVVLAPIFDFGPAPFEVHLLSPKMHLPFLEPLEWKRRGAHGFISRVRIHPDHQLWERDKHTECTRPYLAVKKFSSDQIESFKKERKALLRFSKPRKGHEHLIKLLYSYKFQGNYFMIFPWAQGNLAEAWQKSRCTFESNEDCLWIVRQCWGIADGLRKVHKHDSWQLTKEIRKADNRGRHGDIKPENILHFAEADAKRGRLVVADFTLMRFHSDKSLGRTQASQIGFSQTYRPPEVDLVADVAVTQKYDVWTLGCVYLEFITWYLLGYGAIRGNYFHDHAGEKLESFPTVRTSDDEKQGWYASDKFFNTTNGHVPEVKKSVIKWVQMLHCHEHCSDAMHDFLDLIEKSMLLPIPSDRCSMEEVAASLAGIVANCAQAVYCYHGRPRSMTRSQQFPPSFTEESLKYSQLSQNLSSTDESALEEYQDSDLDAIEQALADTIPRTTGSLQVNDDPPDENGSTLAHGSSVSVEYKDVRITQSFKDEPPPPLKLSSSQESLVKPSLRKTKGGVAEAALDPRVDHQIRSQDSHPGSVNVSGHLPHQSTQDVSVGPATTIPATSPGTRIMLWTRRCRNELQRMLCLG